MTKKTRLVIITAMICLKIMFCVQWPRNQGGKGGNCPLSFQKLSHKNAIKPKNSSFGGHFAPLAPSAFGALRGHWFGKLNYYIASFFFTLEKVLLAIFSPNNSSNHFFSFGNFRCYCYNIRLLYFVIWASFCYKFSEIWKFLLQEVTVL